MKHSESFVAPLESGRKEGRNQRTKRRGKLEVAGEKKGEL